MSRSHSESAGTLVDPADDVRRWRSDRLVAAGFDRPLADRVAADARLDVHALIELTERACPPELAYRILAQREGRDREAAIAELHGLLRAAAGFEVRRRAAGLRHLRGGELDDIAAQAA